MRQRRILNFGSDRNSTNILTNNNNSSTRILISYYWKGNFYTIVVWSEVTGSKRRIGTVRGKNSNVSSSHDHGRSRLVNTKLLIVANWNEEIVLLYKHILFSLFIESNHFHFPLAVGFFFRYFCAYCTVMHYSGDNWDSSFLFHYLLIRRVIIRFFFLLDSAFSDFCWISCRKPTSQFS